MADVAWALPNPRSGGFWLENPSRSGGVAFNGSEQNVFSLAMRWRARWTVSIRTKAEVLAARAMFAQLQGKAGTLLVPFFDGKRASWPIEFVVAGSTGVVLSPGVTRRRELDGTIFEDPEIPTASEIISTVSSNAANRATTIDVEFEQGGPPVAGQYFGLGGNRGYLIHTVTGPASGDVYTLSFFPPLRAAVLSGATVNWTRPVCVMRQTTDDQGIGELEGLRFADLTIDLVEYF